jgi:hypothetical protein
VKPGPGHEEIVLAMKGDFGGRGTLYREFKRGFGIPDEEEEE